MPLDAAEHGADIRTRAEVTHLERRDGLWHIEIAGQPAVTARAVANAAGPAVLDLLARTTGHQRKPDERIRLVRGSHIVVAKMFDTPQAYFCQNPDGRIFFAIPYEDDFTLIGTTDADHQGPLDNITATEEEIRYICESAGVYFKQKITPDDVIYSYAGVRPLVDDGSGKTRDGIAGLSFRSGHRCAGKSAVALHLRWENHHLSPPSRERRWQTGRVSADAGGAELDPRENRCPVGISLWTGQRHCAAGSPRFIPSCPCR
jgi:hypothetical protein